MIAWLITFGYVEDDCGILNVTPYGYSYLRQGLNEGMRATANRNMNDVVKAKITRERM